MSRKGETMIRIRKGFYEHNSYTIVSHGGCAMIKHWVAEHSNTGKFSHWADTLRECVQFCDAIDEGRDIPYPTVHLQRLYM